MAAASSDLGRLMEPVARALLGEPNPRLSSKTDLRFGTNGSWSVDLEAGTIFSHETGEGGGVLWLVEKNKGLTGKAAFDFLRDELRLDIPDDRAPRANGHVNGRHDEPAGKREIEASYDYTDELGNLLFQAQRIVYRLADGSYVLDAAGKRKKTFTQRRPDGAGGWIYNLKGVRLVPYRLPDLLEALAEERNVFIVEGEKKADRLWDLGVPATCNPMGSGKWPAEFSTIFAGANIIHLPDNDDAGRKHTGVVGQALAGTAASQRVLDLPGLPPKGDIVDWLDTGGTVDRLYELVEQTARPWAPAAASNARFKLIPFGEVKVSARPRYLVRGMIPLTGLAVIWGPPKCGKSFWTSDWLFHVALGWPYRGRKVEQGAVVYLILEGETGFNDRIEAFRLRYLSGNKVQVPFFVVATRIDLIADHAQLIADIRSQLGDLRPAAVAIDTLNRSLRGSESSDQDMGNYVKAADALREAFSCVVPIVHHCGMNGERPRGHTSLTGAADAQIAVRRDAEKNIVALIEYMKDGPTGDEIVSKLEVVEVGREPDGHPITSCVVGPVGEAEKAQQKAAAEGFALRKQEEPVFRALLKALRDKGNYLTVEEAEGNVPVGTKVVHYNAWRDAYKEVADPADDGSALSDETIRGRFRNYSPGMVKFGVIGWSRPWLWHAGKFIRGFPETRPMPVTEWKKPGSEPDDVSDENWIDPENELPLKTSSGR